MDKSINLNRINGLQGVMQDRGIDLAVIMQPRDLYYYAGTAQPCNLLVPAVGLPMLFVRRAMEFVRRESSLPQERIVMSSGLDDVSSFITGMDIPVNKVGFTTDAVPASIYLKMKPCFGAATVVNLTPLILEQRMIKDAVELDTIRQAAEIFAVVHETMMSSVKPGLSEIEISARVLKAVRQRKGDSIIRNRRWDCSLPPDGLVVSAPNMDKISGHAMTITGVGLSPALAWGASSSVVKTGDLVMVDIGINLYGYHADLARTYVAGKADESQKEVFAQVKEIQQAVIDIVKPGVRAKDLFWAGFNKACELNVSQYFQGYGDMQGSYVGHGLGLECDELPTLDPRAEIELKPGMVLAIEPKLIIPGWGAIVLEDDLIVNETGYELINPVARELFEVV